MLSLFPDLLIYGFQGTAALRVTLGAIVLTLALYHLRVGRRAARPTFAILSVLEIVAGLLLVVGLYTQAAALVVAVLSLGSMVLNYHHRDNVADGSQFYFYAFQLLLAVTALTLITLGPGAWAFDWPL